MVGSWLWVVKHKKKGVKMLSLSVKTHWRLALRSFKRAVKVTIKEIIRDIKLTFQMNKKSDELYNKKRFFITLERIENEN